MSNLAVPNYISVNRLIKNREVLRGRLAISKLQALSDLVLCKKDSIEFEICSKKDELDKIFLMGQIKASLVLECQRCIKPYHFKIDSQFHLQLIENLDQIKDASLEIEPIIMIDKQFSLYHLIEEEILLNLPLAGRHSDEDLAKGLCKEFPKLNVGTTKSSNPFSLLANSNFSSVKEA